jgi:hypothetical protein
VKYLLMDDRARLDVEDADVLTVSDTLKEARRDRRDFPGAVIVAADEQGEELVNLRVVE